MLEGLLDAIEGSIEGLQSGSGDLEIKRKGLRGELLKELNYFVVSDHSLQKLLSQRNHEDLVHEIELNHLLDEVLKLVGQFASVVTQVGYLHLELLHIVPDLQEVLVFVMKGLHAGVEEQVLQLSRVDELAALVEEEVLQRDLLIVDDFYLLIDFLQSLEDLL